MLESCQYHLAVLIPAALLLPARHVLSAWAVCLLLMPLIEDGRVHACYARVRAAFAKRAPRPHCRRCTAEAGLVDALPSELLPHVLAAGSLSAADLANCAAACSTLAEIVNDVAHDSLLWQPVCRAHWASKAYDPLLVYPA